jgi:AcrR family transcriptional regulator
MQLSDSIKAAFLSLAETARIETITLSSVCKTANVSRTAFYSCFADKNDLIAAIIHDSVVKPIIDLRRLLPTAKLKHAPQLLTEQIYINIMEQRGFFEQLANDQNRAFFAATLTEFYRQMNEGILKARGIAHDEIQYAAYFSAGAHVLLIVKWIREGMKVPPAQMMRYYMKFIQPYWEGIMPRREVLDAPTTIPVKEYGVERR